MAKINGEILLRGDYLLLQNAANNKRIWLSPTTYQLILFVPLPLPAPVSTQQNSTLYMFQSVLEQKMTLTAYNAEKDIADSKPIEVARKMILVLGKY